MAARIASALLLLLPFLGVSQAASSVSVQVYYESLCPDSIKFVTEQLYPTFEELGEYMTVDFNPFGKASWEATPEGGFTFECQHGPDECEGNLYQACLLTRLPQGPIQVDAVNCIMGAEEPNHATQQCMNELGIFDPTYTEVAACQSSTEGENLLQQFGVITHALEPELTWVPWVTINGVYIEEDFDATQMDLYNLLCQKYLTDVPECQ